MVIFYDLQRIIAADTGNKRGVVEVDGLGLALHGNLLDLIEVVYRQPRTFQDNNIIFRVHSYAVIALDRRVNIAVAAYGEKDARVVADEACARGGLVLYPRPLILGIKVIVLDGEKFVVEPGHTLPLLVILTSKVRILRVFIFIVFRIVAVPGAHQKAREIRRIVNPVVLLDPARGYRVKRDDLPGIGERLWKGIRPAVQRDGHVVHGLAFRFAGIRPDPIPLSILNRVDKHGRVYRRIGWVGCDFLPCVVNVVNPEFEAFHRDHLAFLVIPRRCRPGSRQLLYPVNLGAPRRRLGRRDDCARPRVRCIGHVTRGKSQGKDA